MKKRHITSLFWSQTRSFFISCPELPLPYIIVHVSRHSTSNYKIRQCTMHCHLRSPVPSVVSRLQSQGPQCTSLPNFNKIRQHEAWVIDDSTHFPVLIFRWGGANEPQFLTDEWTIGYQMWKKHWSCVVSFHVFIWSCFMNRQNNDDDDALPILFQL